jgi:exonuclease III
VYANFDLKVGTFNIRGQGQNQLKLRKIKNVFNKGNFDILLLQETRSDGSEKEGKKWRKIFLTSFGARSVGAGIIVRDENTFKVHHHFSDPRADMSVLLAIMRMESS